MTSVYEEKLYPQIPATAPPDDESYRLKKIDELEKFLRTEVKSRDKLTKQFKRRATAATFSDTSVITTTSVLGVASIVFLTTGIGMPISIVLASTGLFLGLGSGVIHKTQKLSTKKHDKIKTLAESKLETISGIVSKAIEDSDISHEEYQLILKEIEHYHITIHTANFQNPRSITSADLHNETWIVSSKPCPNLTIPIDQLQIHVLAVAQWFSS